MIATGATNIQLWHMLHQLASHGQLASCDSHSSGVSQEEQQLDTCTQTYEGTITDMWKPVAGWPSVMSITSPNCSKQALVVSQVTSSTHALPTPLHQNPISGANRLHSSMLL